jgi:hypothetical protein
VVELVEVKVMSTSLWIEVGLVVVKPVALSLTVIIFHLPSKEVGRGSVKLDFLQPICVIPRIVTNNKIFFIQPV